MLNSSENATVDVLVLAAEIAVIGNNESIMIEANARNSSFSRELTFTLTVVDSMQTTWVAALEISALPQNAEVTRERSVHPKAVGL